MGAMAVDEANEASDLGPAASEAASANGAVSDGELTSFAVGVTMFGF